MPRSAGLLASDPYASHVCARLLDFFADTTPWPRRLWDISSVLALREAYEVGTWHAQQVLSTGAVTWYLRTLERQLGPDQGIGTQKIRRELTSLLRSDLPRHSAERRRLAQLMPQIVNGYLERWSEAVDSATPPSPERLARAIATHLLDLGHSSGRLHRWTRALAGDGAATMADLFATASRLAGQGDRIFEVLVPFRSVPDHQALATPLPEWRTAPEAARWFVEQKVSEPPRHNGAFRYELSAKDEVAAARMAGALVQRLQARSSYARAARSRLDPVGRVWVAGYPDPLPVQPPARGVDVLSLVREKTMYSAGRSNRLDDALELAAPLNSGPPAPAVSGGWSAVESLLYHPGDPGDVKIGRAVAADRLAAIVASSWPRAELTALSYRHKPPVPDDIQMALARCQTSREHCQVLANALAQGERPAVAAPSDRAAVQRMTTMVTDPHKELNDVRRVIEGVLRRLYRQRNIVVHGGTTAVVALDAALRTAAPLVGAGLDRLVHASLTLKVDPLDLAARAENSLAVVGDPQGPDVASLLE